VANYTGAMLLLKRWSPKLLPWSAGYGNEIVGLIPKSVLLDAGRYFLRKQQRSLGIPEQEIIRMAVLSMGLDDLNL
jgi:hypothetical protein